MWIKFYLKEFIILDIYINKCRESKIEIYMYMYLKELIKIKNNIYGKILVKFLDNLE